MTNANTYTVYDNKTDELVILDGTSKECADAIGIKVNSFYSYLCKSKKNIVRYHIEATKPMINSERVKRVKRVLALRNKGMTITAIANRFKVTAQTISSDLKEYGEQIYGIKTRAIVEEYISNPSQNQSEIARKLGFSQQLVCVAINKYCK